METMCIFNFFELNISILPSPVIVLLLYICTMWSKAKCNKSCSVWDLWYIN